MRWVYHKDNSWSLPPSLSLSPSLSPSLSLSLSLHLKDKACEAMELFDELMECDITLISPFLQQLVEFCLEVRRVHIVIIS